MDKNYTEVTIAGKTYTLGGYEDAEYLQQIAAYINTCISDLHQVPGFLRQSADDQNMMLMLNLADDCFKARKKAASLEAKAEAARQSRPKDCAICFANCCANRCSGCWYCFRIFYPSRPPFLNPRSRLRCATGRGVAGPRR